VPFIVAITRDKDRGGTPNTIPGSSPCHLDQTRRSFADTLALYETRSVAPDRVPRSLVIMIVRYLYIVHELLGVIAQPVEEMRATALTIREWPLDKSGNGSPGSAPLVACQGE
jgi:hypothetical protein